MTPEKTNMSYAEIIGCPQGGCIGGMDPFLNSKHATIPIKEVVEWTKSGRGSRLSFPPIQRSAVWRNSQIINYWDSLLRGYPSGMMMVHRPKDEKSLTRTTDGKTDKVEKTGFELFDGQQRLTAILLGLGEGQLKERLKLWVDLGIDASEGSGLKFALRISSTGQPFGYPMDAPNEKFSLQKRRDKFESWVSRTGHRGAGEAFVEVEGADLIDTVQAVPFSAVVVEILKCGVDGAMTSLKDRYSEICTDRLKLFLDSMDQALNAPIIFQLIHPKVVEDEKEYIRFFGRLGQGGTSLTNDELTYSIIKHQFPHVHDRMVEIVDGPAGRMAGEVNMVLGALRVAKVCAPWKDSSEWEVCGRPHPAFVSRLKEEDLSGVSEQFLRLLPDRRNLLPTSCGGELKGILESIRRKLVYDSESNQKGFPTILLARFPHQLIDALILLEGHDLSGEDLIPFSLYWLLFVGDSDKAANLMFRRFLQNDESWTPAGNLDLVRLFEGQGISRRLPSRSRLAHVRDEIGQGSHILRSWGDRFAALDADKEHPCGEGIRAISTNRELIIRSLLWLQREYLSGKFPGYDPTSNRDEDLPIDLDHLIPHVKFGDDWRRQQNRLSYTDEKEKEDFRHLRWAVGNSLGNYRWLDASDNRSRQADSIDEADGVRDFIEDVPRWNAVIKSEKWSEVEVRDFQKLIDLRTIAVYEELLIHGGFSRFVSRE